VLEQLVCGAIATAIDAACDYDASFAFGKVIFLGPL